jgi:hypothetical protein
MFWQFNLRNVKGNIESWDKKGADNLALLWFQHVQYIIYRDMTFYHKKNLYPVKIVI